MSQGLATHYGAAYLMREEQAIVETYAMKRRIVGRQVFKGRGSDKLSRQYAEERGEIVLAGRTFHPDRSFAMDHLPALFVPDGELSETVFAQPGLDRTSGFNEATHIIAKLLLTSRKRCTARPPSRT